MLIKEYLELKDLLNRCIEYGQIMHGAQTIQRMNYIHDKLMTDDDRLFIYLKNYMTRLESKRYKHIV